MSAAGEVRVRAATPDDVPQIHAFIVELAVYEREPDGVTGTPEMLRDALFGAHRSAGCLIAEVGDEAVGFAVWHYTFSTWECQPGIWLEDLFVPERHRRHGAGYALLSHLSAMALERDCPRVEWHALDWNELALGFYERLGAERLPEWDLHRLEGTALERVASGEARARQ
ncbi:MAG TPA: GNAT family N-acetyltransferase [Solirubrobacteraceae bacterium]|nr:GNAT family N-acetyltransferase [Solirubrobacteraceae bacterium]